MVFRKYNWSFFILDDKFLINTQKVLIYTYSFEKAVCSWRLNFRETFDKRI